MDPQANIEQQLELANKLQWLADTSDGESWAETDPNILVDVACRAQALAEHVIALHEWIMSGGFLPEVWPVSPRALALGRLIEQRGHISQLVVNGPDNFTLAGYWVVLFQDGFECGIAPDGSVSS